MEIAAIIEAMQVAAAFVNNIAAAAAAIKQQEAEGRGPTPEEIALAQKVTAQKRALAEAS
jgi:hypothetical protein